MPTPVLFSCDETAQALQEIYGIRTTADRIEQAAVSGMVKCYRRWQQVHVDSADFGKLAQLLAKKPGKAESRQGCR